jgi:uncharacterized membrane protein YidH (DUF202 family)
VTTALFDPGLQPERTLLAWRRTSAAVAAAGAVVARAAAHWVGDAAAWVALGGALVAALTWVAATVRYRRLHRSLTRTGEGHPEPAGPAVAALTLALVCLSVGGALWLATAPY